MPYTKKGPFTNVPEETTPPSGAVPLSAATLDDMDTGIFDAHSEMERAANKGVASGYASLDSGAKVPSAQLPALALTDVYSVASEAAQLALTAQEGDVAVRTDLNRSYAHNGGVAGTMADWTELRSPTDAVTSVDGRVGVVTLSDIYAPLVEQMNYFPQRFVLFGGVSGLVQYGNAMAFQLRALQNDYFAFQAMVPTHWSAFDVDLYWACVDATTGNPTFRFDRRTQDVGQALNTTYTVGTNFVGDAAGGALVLVKSVLATNVIADPAKEFMGRVFRMANPADGLSVNIGAERVVLRRSL